MCLKRLCDAGGKAVAIDSQRAAGGHLMRIGLVHDQRARAAHLFVQEADRIRLRIVGAERVGADKLRAIFCLMRVGFAHRAHLVKDHLGPGVRRLPSGFRAGEPCADNVDFSVFAHKWGSSALILRRNKPVRRPNDQAGRHSRRLSVNPGYAE